MASTASGGSGGGGSATLDGEGHHVLVAASMPGLHDAIRKALEEVPVVGATVSLLPDPPKPSTDSEKKEAFLSALSTATIVLAGPTGIAPYLHLAPKLQWLQSTFAGVDALVGCSQRDYALTRMGELSAMGEAMAESVLLTILAVHRDLPRLLAAQRRSEWIPEEEYTYTPLRGQQLGVLGAGAIGTAVARSVSAGLNMKVVGLRSRDPPTGTDVTPFTTITSNLLDVLSTSQFIVNLLPSTPATANLLTPELLKEAAALRDGRLAPPVLINFGRGSVIAEETVCTALEDGSLGYAVLDVFDTEPLASESPLWQHPKVMITPHVAALSFAQDTCDVFVRNLRTLLTKGPSDLECRVDWEKGY